MREERTIPRVCQQCGSKFLAYSSTANNPKRGKFCSRRCTSNSLRTDASRHPFEYSVWADMKTRCTSPRNPSFHRYGGRGIRVCVEWSASFAAFLRDVGPRPSADHSLDRINNDGNYEPGNVRWATRREQGRNTSKTRLLTLEGVIRPLVEWADLYGITSLTLTSRLGRGWSLERALTDPVWVGHFKNSPTCANGHLWTEETTYWRKDHPRRRNCRACVRERSAKK